MTKTTKLEDVLTKRSTADIVRDMEMRSMKAQIETTNRRLEMAEECNRSLMDIAHEFYAIHQSAAEVPAVKDALDQLLVTIRLADPKFMDRLEEYKHFPPFVYEMEYHLKFNKKNKDGS